MSTKVSPFDFVKSITDSKENIFEGNEASYNPYIINKALASNLDCLFVVDELNRCQNVPNYAQYLYLMHSIDKKKRYGSWLKKESIPDDIELIKEAYGYSDEKAASVLCLFSDKTLLELRKCMTKGGRV